jgi:hypothetical protein
MSSGAATAEILVNGSIGGMAFKFLKRKGRKGRQEGQRQIDRIEQ